jgi:hypothetical protein
MAWLNANMRRNIHLRLSTETLSEMAMREINRRRKVERKTPFCLVTIMLVGFPTVEVILLTQNLGTQYISVLLVRRMPIASHTLLSEQLQPKWERTNYLTPSTFGSCLRLTIHSWRVRCMPRIRIQKRLRASERICDLWRSRSYDLYMLILNSETRPECVNVLQLRACCDFFPHVSRYGFLAVSRQRHLTRSTYFDLLVQWITTGGRGLIARLLQRQLTVGTRSTIVSVWSPAWYRTVDTTEYWMTTESRNSRVIQQITYLVIMLNSYHLLHYYLPVRCTQSRTNLRILCGLDLNSVNSLLVRLTSIEWLQTRPLLSLGMLIELLESIVDWSACCNLLNAEPFCLNEMWLWARQRL